MLEPSKKGIGQSALFRERVSGCARILERIGCCTRISGGIGHPILFYQNQRKNRVVYPNHRKEGSSLIIDSNILLEYFTKPSRRETPKLGNDLIAVWKERSIQMRIVKYTGMQLSTVILYGILNKHLFKVYLYNGQRG